MTDELKIAAAEPYLPEPEDVRPGWAPVVVNLADVEPEEVVWLWEPYLPIGKLSLLEGDPGLGKTWLALTITAALTRGYPLPSADGRPGAPGAPRNVLYLSAEDGLGDTLRPRLDAAGADPRRVHAVTGKRTLGEDGQAVDDAITLADVPTLRAAIEQVRPALVVIDPLQAYLGASVDMNRANETRPLLSALGELAQAYGFAAVIIRHLRKSSSDRAVYRGAGSIDFSAAARSILLVGAEPDNERRRVLAHVKSSLAEPGASLGFELREGAFHWLGASAYSAEQLLAQPATGEERSARDEASAWLLEMLAQGPALTRELRQAAARDGLGWRTIEQAKGTLGVTARRQSFGNTGRGEWTWELQDRKAPNEESPAALRPCSTLDQDETLARPQDRNTATLESPAELPSPGSQLSSNGAPLAMLDGRAAELARELANASPEQLAATRAAGKQALPPNSPTAWDSTAATEALAVTVAERAMALDHGAGNYRPGSAWLYLRAARQAVAQLEVANA